MHVICWEEKSKTETSWFEEVPFQVCNSEPSAVASSAVAKTKQVSKTVSKILRYFGFRDFKFFKDFFNAEKKLKSYLSHLCADTA